MNLCDVLNLLQIALTFTSVKSFPTQSVHTAHCTILKRAYSDTERTMHSLIIGSQEMVDTNFNRPFFCRFFSLFALLLCLIFDQHSYLYMRASHCWIVNSFANKWYNSVVIESSCILTQLLIAVFVITETDRPRITRIKKNISIVVELRILK